MTNPSWPIKRTRLYFLEVLIKETKEWTEENYINLFDIYIIEDFLMDGMYN